MSTFFKPRARHIRMNRNPLASLFMAMGLLGPVESSLGVSVVRHAGDRFAAGWSDCSTPARLSPR